MGKIIKWLGESNRYKHLIGGVFIGAGSDDMYCAAYSGVGIAGALELKDKLYGGSPDAVDFVITLVGVAIGYTLRCLIISAI